MAWSKEDVEELQATNRRLHNQIDEAKRERDTFEAQAKVWRLIVMDVIAGAREMSGEEKEHFIVPPIEMLDGWREHKAIVESVKLWWGAVVNGFSVKNLECAWCQSRYDGSME